MKVPQRSVHAGCIISHMTMSVVCTVLHCCILLYNTQWRGLAELLISVHRQCEGLTIGISDESFSHVFFVSVTELLTSNILGEDMEKIIIKKMRKLLVLLCFLIFVPFGAFAEVYSGVCGKRTVNEGKDVVWSCDTETGVLTISGSGKMDSYSSTDIKRGINPPWEGTAPYYEDSCVPFIRHVIVEEGVTALGRYSFRKLNHLSTISLPEGLESVSYESFGGCITSVTIPSTVKSLDFRAFEWCDFIESITLLSSIPIGIDGITDEHFYDQNQIVLKVPDVEAYKNSDWAKYFSRIEPISDNEEEKPKVYSGECGHWTFITIEGMPVWNYIKTGVFWSLDIESGVLALSGKGIIPDYSLNPYEGQYPPWFKYHMYITSVKIENGVALIGRYAFYGCNRLKSIVIPESVTYIDSSAFDACNSLPTEDNIRYADKWAVGVIDKEQTEYSLRKNTVGIAAHTFVGCSFSSIEIPENVTRICEAAFWGCPLTQVKSFALMPPKINSYMKSPSWGTYADYDIFYHGEDAILKVPTASVEAYKNSDWARYFNNIGEIPGSGISEIKFDTNNRTFDLTGRRNQKETKGQIYIKNGKKYIAK